MTSDAVPQALSKLTLQPRVQEFLARAVTSGQVGQSYLFLGDATSGMMDAALALARCIVCPNGGCDSCDECRRVSHRTHPDVRVLEPEGVSGYMVEQIRALTEDAALTPSRGQHKVYIVSGADGLRDASANALLKTIEEPPSFVTFILLASARDAVLPTIVSRCQLVPFAHIEPAAAARALELSCGATGTNALIALTVAGTPDGARAWLTSATRPEARRIAVNDVAALPAADAWDVICYAREIVEKALEPFGEPAPKSKGRKKPARKKNADPSATVEEDFLSDAALRKLEDARKRALSQSKRSAIIEVIAAVESLLRDVLITLERADQTIVNADVVELVRRLAAGTTPAGVVRALDACAHARLDLSRNVNPNLTFEVMLFSVKEALTCPPSSR